MHFPILFIVSLSLSVHAQVRSSFSSPYATYATEYDSVGYRNYPRERDHYERFDSLHRHVDDGHYDHGSYYPRHRQAAYPYPRYQRISRLSDPYRQSAQSVYARNTVRQIPFRRTSSISSGRDYYPVAPRQTAYERFAAQPYSFEYAVNGLDGSQERRESGDGSGRVNGAYSFSLPDGRRRLVQYTADEGGFRAKVDTNEAGTESQSPAAVQLFSSAVPGPRAAILSDRNYQY
ncbi:cuticle protein 18.6 [Galendromus occidentalis]|uniref:Cuticle protein 18.6 n=1 Tax=Galendromus occidentalis TaxID=34638 RepID=A0AAJ6QM09_9ACAR|nr:cuticle protein 18.6 [Galendromus occidentalis]